jgi:hypothetical protein
MELQKQALWIGKMNQVQGTRREVVSEKGRDMSSIETRGKAEKMGSNKLLFSMEIIESACLIAFKYAIRTVVVVYEYVSILGGRM